MNRLSAYLFGLVWLVERLMTGLTYAMAGVRIAVAIAISPLLFVLFHVCNPLFLWILTPLWPHRDIVGKEGLYLRRFYLTPRLRGKFRYFLHYIRLSDSDRNPHDHPWDFKSRILRNSYTEKVYYPYSRVPTLDRTQPHLLRSGFPGRVLDNKAEHVHMVLLDSGPVWSLVKAGPARRKWGFWNLDPTDPSKDGWTFWRDYLNVGKHEDSWKEDTQ